MYAAIRTVTLLLLFNFFVCNIKYVCICIVDSFIVPALWLFASVLVVFQFFFKLQLSFVAFLAFQLYTYYMQQICL